MWMTNKKCPELKEKYTQKSKILQHVFKMISKIWSLHEHTGVFFEVVTRSSMGLEISTRLEKQGSRWNQGCMSHSALKEAAPEHHYKALLWTTSFPLCYLRLKTKGKTSFMMSCSCSRRKKSLSSWVISSDGWAENRQEAFRAAGGIWSLFRKINQLNISLEEQFDSQPRRRNQFKWVHMSSALRWNDFCTFSCSWKSMV